MGIVILAAGASSRMGRPKLLLPWGHHSILGHLRHQWQTAGATQIAVVLDPSHHAIAAALDQLGVPMAHRILNPDPGRGMFSSIQCAAQWPGWDPRLTHWGITLGDQPQVRPDTLRQLLDQAGQRPNHICQPARHGRPKHPVILPKAAFLDLAQASASDLKQFLSSKSNQRLAFESDDPGLDLDIDRPEDYQRALAWAGLD